MKKGFTLAEVLITLAIIGIIAAMTFPTLINNYNKEQTVVKLKRAIGIINQAYMMSYTDNGSPNEQSAYSMGAEEYFKTYWAPYIKTAVLCKTIKQCSYKSSTPWGLLNGQNNVPINIVDARSRVSFYTPDGFFYVVLIAAGSHVGEDGEIVYVTNSQIAVDLNGAKGPNIFGKDVFMLTRTTDGTIEPYGNMLSKDQLIKYCSQTWYGNTCAELIRSEGWAIGKDYPW